MSTEQDLDALYAAHTGMGQAQAAVPASPNDAAEAIKFGQPSAMDDVATLRKSIQDQQNAAIVQRSPQMARWASGDPAKVAASQDSFGPMEKIANGIQATEDYFKTSATQVWSGIYQGLKQDIAATQQADVNKGVSGIWQRPLTTGKLLLDSAMALPNAMVGPLLNAFYVRPLAKGFEQVAPSEEIQKKYGMASPTEAAWNTLWGLGYEGLEAPAFRTTPGAIATEHAAEVSGIETEAVKQAAQQHGELLSAMRDSVHDTPVHGRSPQTVADFIGQQTSGGPLENLKISGEAVRDAYAKAGKFPHPEDGILGWQPDIYQQIQRSLLTGSDIEVPTAGYLSHVDDAAHEAMLPGIRVVDQPSMMEAEQVPDMGVSHGDETIPTSSEPEVDAALREQQAEIRRVKKEASMAYLKPLFEEPKAAGMTDPQFAQYSKKIEAAQQALDAKLVEKATATIKRARTAAWRERVPEEMAAKLEELHSRPAVQAYSVLAEGKLPDGTAMPGLKLSPEGIDTTGLPKKAFAKGGLPADDAAEYFGYDSGEAMLDDLRSMEIAKAAMGAKNLQDFLGETARAATESKLREEIGSFDPEAVAAAAREAVAAPEVSDLLSTELQALAKEQGLPFKRGDLERQAMESFGQLPVKQAVNFREFTRQVVKHGRSAEMALLKGDTPKAFEAKQHQFMQQAMLKQSYRLARQFDRDKANFAKWAKDADMKSVDPDYRNWMHWILRESGFNVRVDEAALDKAVGGKSYPAWAQEQLAQGYPVYLMPWEGVPFGQHTVNGYLNLSDALNSLRKIGRSLRQFDRLGEQVSFDFEMDRVRTKRAAVGDNLTLDQQRVQSFADRTRSAMRSFDASHVVQEFLVDQLDNGDVRGPFNDNLLRPLEEGKHTMDTLQEGVASALKDLRTKLPKGWYKGWRKKIDAPEFLYDHPEGGQAQLIRQKSDVLTYAMLWGTEENKLALADGTKFPAEQWQALFDKHMTKDDWRWVQGMWDTLKPLWKEKQAQHFRETGIELPEYEPSPFTIEGENFAGGHAPLFYDPILGKDVAAATEDSPFGTDFMRRLPSQGYAKSRTGYSAPPIMNPELFLSRIGQMIHDVSFREPVINARKFINAEPVKAYWQSAVGPEYYKAAQAWIDRIAARPQLDDKGIATIANLMTRNFVRSQIGFLFTTMEKHAASALFKSADEVGYGPLTGALQKMAREGVMNSWRQALSESQELRRRGSEVDRAFRDHMNDLIKRQGFISRAQHAGMAGIGFSDQLSAVPTYMAARDAALAQGMSHADAVYAGEKAIRRAHGASSKVDLPLLLSSDNPFMRMLTPFMTFMNNTYNRVRLIGQDVRGGVGHMRAGEGAHAARDFGRAFMSTASIVLLPAIFVSKITNQNNEDPEESFWKNLGWTLAGELTAGVFGGSILWNLEQDEQQGTGTISQLMNMVVQDKQDLEHWGKQDQLPDRWVKDSLHTTGYLTGLPTGQAAKTGQYLYDWMNGRESPQNAGEAGRGLLFGPPYKGKGRR